ncbi:helix-turn-helix domain-containing protein [Campylobacter showae]|uniref:helix-turn-helix domain-containing protein n=1 Tax=Campylobacter showae TaxID=204 RepID=UPI000F07D1A6|nr:helix-turn-helix domain-containing protein [Campylobacter showae]
MSKVPVSEAAEILGVTKEAVYNRIRRGTLKTFEKDGVKYVVLEGYEPQTAPKSAPKTSKSAKSSESKKATKVGEFDVNEFLLSQISELKEQNQNLQADKDRLFREKEQILLNNKTEIAQIYRERDEKLRGFLSMLERPLLARQNGEYAAPIDVEFVESKPENEGKWTSLAEFLKSQNLSGKSLKKTQNKIIKNIGKSKFIKFKKGVIMVKSKKISKELDKK